MQNKKHNLLFISYFFPPSGGISCQRAIRFAKFLPKFGWDTTVLTYDGNYPWKIIDRTLLEKSCSIPTIKIPASEIENYYSGENGIDCKMKTLLSGVLNIDVMSNWTKSVEEKLPKIIDEKRPDLILLTAPPFSSLELVQFIKKIDAKIPVIVDMRDLYWILNPSGSIIKRIINFHQRSTAMAKIPMWLSLADGFIAPSDAILSKISNEYHSPAITVPTPYDPDDFDCARKYKKNKMFKILHSGRIYRSNKPEYLFKIFSLLPSDILKRTRLILQGHNSDEARKIFSSLPWTQLTDSVPHEQALSSQCASDVNLVYVTESSKNDGDLIIPGKIFDYIGAGRPIFAIGPQNGALVSFVEQNKLGFSASTESPELSAEILSKIFRLWENDKLESIPSDTQKEIRSKFSANAIVSELARFLEKFLD
ncbi:hypothetical protein J7L68_05665 [bacterium]|nr:hypothetical protein [bacterium]